MQRFNSAMGYVRLSVEWSFGKVANTFAFIDFAKNMKALLQPVGKFYLLSVLFTNCHTCLYGSETSYFFNCPPPSLEEYLIPEEE